MLRLFRPSSVSRSGRWCRWGRRQGEERGAQRGETLAIDRVQADGGVVPPVAHDGRPEVASVGKTEEEIYNTLGLIQLRKKNPSGALRQFEQAVALDPRYIEAHPDTVQHLVNAFVRTMRFINSHSAEEIAAKLPPDYFTGKNRAAEVKLIRDTLPTFARCENNFMESINRRPASKPPRIPNVKIAPAPRGRYCCASL